MAHDIYKALEDVLLEPEMIPVIQTMAPEAMNAAAKEVLAVIYRHFVKTPGKRRRMGDDEPEPRVGRSSMHCLIIIRRFYLEPHLDRLIRDPQTDPHAVLLAGQTLNLDLRRHTTKETLGEAFFVRYEFTLKMVLRQARHHVSWCFAMMMFYDLIKIVKPKATGARVGHLMKGVAVDFIRGVAKNLADQAHGHIDEWSRYGKKISNLCDAFGPGCIFFLADQLSEDFVKHKYCERGLVHDAAFEHLASLDLKTLAEESGANALAQLVRDILIQPFRDHLRPL